MSASLWLLVEIVEHELIRAFPATQSALPVTMAMIDIAIEKDLADALALVPRRMKALLLRRPNQWVRCSDTEHPGMVHWSQPIHAKHPFLRPAAQRRVPPRAET